MIRFACSNCNRLISVDEKYSGKKGKCPKCGSGVVVPERSTIIEFSCGSCGHKISVPERQGGKKGACPKCKNRAIRHDILDFCVRELGALGGGGQIVPMCDLDA